MRPRLPSPRAGSLERSAASPRSRASALAACGPGPAAAGRATPQIPGPPRRSARRLGNTQEHRRGRCGRGFGRKHVVSPRSCELRVAAASAGPGRARPAGGAPSPRSPGRTDARTDRRKCRGPGRAWRSVRGVCPEGSAPTSLLAESSRMGTWCGGPSRPRGFARTCEFAASGRCLCGRFSGVFGGCVRRAFSVTRVGSGRSAQSGRAPGRPSCPSPGCGRARAAVPLPDKSWIGDTERQQPAVWGKGSGEAAPSSAMVGKRWPETEGAVT